MNANDTNWADRTSNAILLIRILVGSIFVSEGVQKFFIIPETRGLGRFLKIGIPWPNVMAPFVGTVEIVCGTLVLAGLATQLAPVPLVCILLVALYSTKLVGLSKSEHLEGRVDFSMLLCLILTVQTGALVSTYLLYLL